MKHFSRKSTAVNILLAELYTKNYVYLLLEFQPVNEIPLEDSALRGLQHGVWVASWEMDLLNLTPSDYSKRWANYECN